MPRDNLEFHKIKAVTMFPVAQLDKILSDALERDERDRKLIAARLRSIRERYGVSLREISKRLKLSAAYVSDVELGRRKLTVDFADRFVEALAKEKRKGMSSKTANSKHH